MSTRSATSARPARARSASAKRAAAKRKAEIRRRRIVMILATAALAFLAAIVVRPMFNHAVREITLPLRHEDIIRQQARDKDIDAALIAGVIYAESHFRDGQVSSAGAQGLMQITPETAQDIARWSGGTSFKTKDLHTPQVNIAYGAYYLRHLLQRYGGNEALALAAYNAGAGNVDKWLVDAGNAGRAFRVQDIPFPETRGYVQTVEDAQRQYRANYAAELGL